MEQISRLEASLAEAFSRSSNPLRTTQTIKDQFEVKTGRGEPASSRNRTGVLRVKATWDEEKKRLTGG